MSRSIESGPISDVSSFGSGAIVRTAAVAAAGLAVLVLIGWQFDLELLKRVGPALVAMNPLTATAFLLAAVALWLLAAGDPDGVMRRWVMALGGAVALIGLLRLLAYLGGPDAGLDQLLFRSRLRTGGPLGAVDETLTNRMAPNTACLFLLSGIALMLQAGQARWRWAAAKALAIVVALLASLAIIGYLNNVTSLYRPTAFIPIAIHTAVGFLIVALGLVAVRPSSDAAEGSDVGVAASGADVVLRKTERYIPLGFAVALFLISVIGIVSYASIRQFAEDTRLIDRQHTTVATITELAATMYDLDAGARGYLVSGAAPLLEPYTAGLAALDPTVERLRDLARDAPAQQQRLERLEVLIDRKLGFLREAIALRDAEGVAAAERLMAEGEGARLMEEIRQQLRSMQADEARQLAERKEASTASAAVTVAVIGIGSGLAFVLVAISGWLIRRDVQLRREVEADLRRARDDAHAANQIKSEFLANMSHEIRTPMTAIIGYADLLLDPAQTGSDRLNYVNTIRRNGEHLLTIINDVLDLSKIEAGKSLVDPVPCAPCGILSDVASLMRVRASEKALPFVVRTEGPIPETILSDPTRLRQILINLIGNAIKFTDAGWVRLIVKLDEDEATGRTMLRFDVIDTGIGMTAEETKRLFQPFGQADNSTTRRFGGTGLGLTICKRLAEMLDGRIEVDSSPGRGSTFSLLVDTGPLDEVRMLADCHEALMSLEPARACRQATALRGRILLVDDGLDNRQLISVYLRQAGAEVTVAEDGKIACEKALAAMGDGRPFDLILMDMQMPVLDGYGATSRLRAKGCDVPIIAITAHAMAEDREKCLKAGCTDYLSKPIRRDAILQMLAGYLDGAAERRSDPPEAAASAAPDEAEDEAVRAFLGSYIEGLPEQVRQMQELLERGALEELAAVTHNLKGTGGLYGFMAITEAAARAEAQIREGGSLEAIAREVEQLVATVEQVQANPHRFDDAGEPSDR